MKSVNIAELRNRLSHYLRLVRRGGPILVTDRGRTIARIEPVAGPEVGSEGEDRRLAELEQRGVLRRPSAPASRDWPRDLQARRVRTGADVVAALLRDRAEGR